MSMVTGCTTDASEVVLMAMLSLMLPDLFSLFVIGLGEKKGLVQFK